MTLRRSSTVSTRIAYGTSTLLGLSLLMGACADTPDDLDADERRAEAVSEADAEQYHLRDGDPVAHAEDCSGLPSRQHLAIAGPQLEGRDLVLPAGDGAVRLTVRNLDSEPLVVEPRLTWRFTGGLERDLGERFELAPGAEHELVIDLDRDLDTRAYPASLDVQLRPWHGRARGVDASFPTLHFHTDPRSGGLHVYDHAGMVARHRAGDLLGTHRAVDTRDDVAGVGIARVPRPEDLAGDPVDARTAQLEGELR